ncbi:hypothetical protein WMY93_012316 [Mugilogobius chulae]|uniref:Uncharacterized protein n=1 Tax=Mugilogobius chulae TaxID=88201 RepID=A0AAW0P5C9_9GOBI
MNELHSRYGPRGLVILGVPCNQFGHQENCKNDEILRSLNSIKKIADFLNSFDMSCRSRLATLNEKLTALERRIEYIEARVTKGETLT